MHGAGATRPRPSARVGVGHLRGPDGAEEASASSRWSGLITWIDDDLLVDGSDGATAGLGSVG